MSEKGGPACQSGIRYQNVVAAEWFAKMLNKINNIETVRVESPVSVDDIVIKFYGRNSIYQQVKEWAPKGGQWTVSKMKYIWPKFIKQYEEDPHCTIQFVSCSPATILHSLCEKANNSPNLSDFKKRINQEEKQAFKEIIELVLWDEQPLYIFFKNVGFKTPYLQERDIESNVLSAYLNHFQQPKLAFRALIDLASSASSRRKQFSANKVITYLKEEGLKAEIKMNAPLMNKQFKENKSIEQRVEAEGLTSRATGVSQIIESNDGPEYDVKQHIIAKKGGKVNDVSQQIKTIKRTSKRKKGDYL